MGQPPGLKQIGRRKVLQAAGLAGAGFLLPAAFAATTARAGGGTTAAGIDELVLCVDWQGGGPPLDMTRGPLADYQAFALSVALEGLLQIDENGMLQPGLAESWSNPDPLTYVFRLRRGIRFWDGTPLTPEDVIYAFTRHRERRWASNFASAFPERFASIDVSGEGEITFRLEEGYAHFAAVAATTPSYVVKAGFARAHVEDIGTSSVLTMGTGPFRIRRYVADDCIELVRNEHYWGAKPPIKRLVLKAIADTESSLLALKAGEIDGSLYVPPRAADRWSALANVGIIDYPSALCWWVAFDREVAPLGDIHVRRALAHGLDRRGLIEAVFRGRGRLAQTFAPPETWRRLLPERETEAFYASLPQNEFDLDRARAELARSSVPRGFEITVPVEAMPEAEKIMQAWQAGLARIGVRMNLQSMSRNEYRAMVFRRTRRAGILLNRWGTEYPDPMWNPSATFTSDQALEGGWNLSNLRDATIDALVRRSMAITDPAARASVIQDVLTRVAADAGFFFLFWPDQVVAFDERKVRVDSFVWWASMSSAWPRFLHPPR